MMRPAEIRVVRRRAAAIVPVAPTDASWRLDAACRGSDPHLFFGEHGSTGDEAKAICVECPVAGECLHDAVAHREPVGIRGGHNINDRRRWHRAIKAVPRVSIVDGALAVWLRGNDDPALDDADHGTLYTYTELGCRCDDCQKAEADYRRQYRAAKRAEAAS